MIFVHLSLSTKRVSLLSSSSVGSSWSEAWFTKRIGVALLRLSLTGQTNCCAIFIGLSEISVPTNDIVPRKKLNNSDPRVVQFLSLYNSEFLMQFGILLRVIGYNSKPVMYNHKRIHYKKLLLNKILASQACERQVFWRIFYCSALHKNKCLYKEGNHILFYTNNFLTG